MRAKTVSAILGVILVAGLLIGCAPAADEAPAPSDEEQPAAAETETEEPAAAETEVIEWACPCAVGESGPMWTHMIGALTDSVAEMSGGRFIITPYPAGALCAAFEVTDAVQGGVAPMGWNWPGQDIGKDKTCCLFGGGPASPSSEEYLHLIYYGGGLELWEEWGADVLGLQVFPGGLRPAETGFWSSKPIRGLDDFDCLKIRTAGIWGDLLPELGASAVSLPGGETFEALERGVIDATEWGSPYEDLFAGFYEIVDYIIVPGVHQPAAPFMFMVDPDAWASLPDEYKAMVRAGSDQSMLQSWTYIGVGGAEAYQTYAEHGNEIIVLPIEVNKKVKELREAYDDAESATNPWYDKVVESQRAFLELWKSADQYRNVQYE